ncbi:MAG TPA: Stk1 family PASTA domain-containing Ser/Thr kinase [Pseudolysinimonas sp.]|nr:Stk1 family PASTA domain-containing Ser/Thr kinase [Pseudolysinimonas sp.]
MAEGVAADVRLLAGRYQIGELLGRGGMADVHAGTDSRLGRRVAIKLLKPSLATDPAFRTRFRQEAQAAARMANPTIVRVYDAGEETVTDASGAEIQVPFIVMEYVEGTLLKDRIAEGPIEPAEAGRIVEGILTALEYSHRAGVVHRDIKPGNVMVTTTGQVKVMDFGIARAISDSSATIAQTSAILGTAQYFSPEQARGEAIDARTDLYSTGVVLYELLTGRPPFRGETAVATAYQHVSEAPTPPNVLNHAISPALNSVVLRALAKDKLTRFQTAAEFREDLKVALSGKVPDRTAAGDDFNTTLFGVNPTSSATSEATLRRLANDEDDRTPRTQSRPPVAWVWAIIAMLVVIVAAAAFWIVALQPQKLITDDVAIKVPNVIGQTWTEGGNQLLKVKLTPIKVDVADDKTPEGQIVATDPPVGTHVAPGQEIRVSVSTGPPKVALPNLVQQTEEAAKAQLAALGLVYDSTVTANSADTPAGSVTGVQLPPSKDLVTEAKQVVKGAKVILVVSSGNVEVPDVTGQDITAAKDTLESESYRLIVNLVPDKSCTGQKVQSQSIVGEQPQHSTVSLTYCAG